MPVSFVGVDVSKATLDVYVEVNGKPRHHQFVNAVFGFKDLDKWLRRWSVKDIHICMRILVDVHQYAFGEGWKVSVVNPNCIAGPSP